MSASVAHFSAHNPARVWLYAPVGERRIEVLALHGADGARDVAIAWIRDALQGGGKVEQECVTACQR
jgi:hypothetical protein